MGIKDKIVGAVKNSVPLYTLYYTLHYTIPAKLGGRARDIRMIKKRYKRTFGRPLDLNDPQTLNEKIQWLKLNERNDFQTLCADKYRAREYLKTFGEDSLIPLLYHTDDWKTINFDTIPDVPCIIKGNSGSGNYIIVRNKDEIDIEKLRLTCHRWMVQNYYYTSNEWQYKNIKPCIIIEQLLLDKNGHIPNDYKLHYINGELQFVYCSIDREGENYRSIYTPAWERMDIEWVAPREHKGLKGADIPCPKTFPRMREIGDEIAKRFKYVRVDFYDVDGRLYYGEITLHHGSGFDTFVPEKYDKIYGEKLKL